MTLPFEPNDDPDFDSVWLWFEFQMDLIKDDRQRVLQSFFAGSRTEGYTAARDANFVGLTRAEVEQFFDAQRGQLELLTMFELLATAEAILRINFQARVVAKRKDGLSKRFRDIHKKFGEKVRLDGHILTALKEEGMPATVIAAFRGALRLRHWLAHGRYWHPKLGGAYSPGDVFDIAKALTDAIPG